MMNIFQKIILANKFFKIYEEIKDFEGIKEVKEGIDLIKQGVEKIALVVPGLKGFVEKLKEGK